MSTDWKTAENSDDEEDEINENIEDDDGGRRYWRQICGKLN